MNSDDKAKIIEALDKQLNEVLSLRFSGKLLHADADINEVLNALLEIRQKFNRIEGIYLDVLSLQRKVHDAYSTAKSIRENAWAEVIVETTKSVSIRGNDYSTGKEREALIRPKIYNEIRDESIAESVSKLTDGTVKQISIAYYGIKSYLDELLARYNKAQSDLYL